MNADKIAVFADIPNQKVGNLTVKKLEETLKGVELNSFESFDPKGISSSFLPSVMGDSQYGARIGEVKRIIAQSLYSREKFSSFLFVVSKYFQEKAEEDQKKYTSLKYKALKQIKLIPERIRLALGKKGNYRGDYLRGYAIENMYIKKNVTISRIYEDMANVVMEIQKEFGQRSAEDILLLSELNHYFSGKWNGSKLNLTFTNEEIRNFGSKLQQLVQRVWNAEICVDTPNPLSYDELFPVEY